jgi:hypothetical protein
MRALLIAVIVAVLCVGCIKPPEPVAVDWEQVVAQAEEQAYAKGYTVGKAEGLKALEQYDLLLKKPSFDEVMAFIKEDGTDQMMVANCLTRAERLNNEAINHGIWCYVVLFNYFTGESYGFHAIVAFDTKDKGLIYIEPQTDDVVKCDIGVEYGAEMCRSGKICPTEKMFIRQIGVIK